MMRRKSSLTLIRSTVVITLCSIGLVSGCTNAPDEGAINGIKSYCQGQIRYEFEREAPRNLNFSSFCDCLASEWEPKLNSAQKGWLTKYSDELGRGVLTDEHEAMYEAIFEFGPESAKSCGWDISG